MVNPYDAYMPDDEQASIECKTCEEFFLSEDNINEYEFVEEHDFCPDCAEKARKDWQILKENFVLDHAEVALVYIENLQEGKCLFNITN